MKYKYFVSRRQLLLSMLAMAIAVKGCGEKSSNNKALSQHTSDGVASVPINLYGAGATFPSFIYLRWFQEYNALHPNRQISYQPIGSAAGIQQFISQTVDFGASEVPLTEAEMEQITRGAVFIPSVAGSIAIVYNLPGVDSGLKLSRQVLPDIFLGKITRWNDPAIAELNPDLSLPDLPIIVVHRSDGSGTTAAFTAHLNAISSAWQNNVGTGLSVQWLVGHGIKDNAGISAQIQQGEGVIGYVEYAFAKQLSLSMAALENQAGQFLLPTTEATARAIADIQLEADLRGAAADPQDPDAYPIVTYSWILAYRQYDDPQKAEVLQDVIRWGLTEGQPLGLELGYVPLPDTVVAAAIAMLEEIGKK